MKEITSVSVPVAAPVVLSGDVRAQANPWSVSFDLGTQLSLTGDVHGDRSGTVLSPPTQVEAPIKWQGDADDLDGLAGTGLESINDESRRWSMPIADGITVRF